MLDSRLILCRGIIARILCPLLRHIGKRLREVVLFFLHQFGSGPYTLHLDNVRPAHFANHIGPTMPLEGHLKHDIFGHRWRSVACRNDPFRAVLVLVDCDESLSTRYCRLSLLPDLNLVVHLVLAKPFKPLVVSCLNFETSWCFCDDACWRSGSAFV